MMDEQQKKNWRLILIIAAMSILPLALAWLFQHNPQWLAGSTNHGRLIIPPVMTERTEFNAFDAFSRDNMGELQGRWIMLHVIPGAQCTTECGEALLKTKRLWLMMNKDLTRIRRLVLLFGDVTPETAAAWWQDDDRLLRARPSETLIEKIKTIAGGKVEDGMLLLIDPLGNLMMQYPPGFDPYDVRDDLKRLLQVSQIG
jgi:hypothetical protein